jgi:phosphate transport system substrate-binding protein
MYRAATAMLSAVAAIGLSAAGTPVAAQTITGAGSTLASPIYAKWGEAAKAATGVTLNYQAIGSGAGLNQITNRTVDFGASDAPVPPAKLQAASLMQFPTVMGAVVVMANVPGMHPGELKLTGQIVAEAYLGTVRKWNDPQIAKLNPGVKLPSTAIAPIYRADASGTTYVFTTYLSAVSPDWKSKVGASTSVRWPAGNGAKGSDGVSAMVKQVRGTLSYVEYSYAAQNHLNYTQLQNRDGAFLEPTMENFEAAAAAADWAHADDFAISLVDMPGAKSWPIVTPTFVLLPTDPKDPAKAAAVIKMFDWAYTNGASTAQALDFIPLPQPVVAQVRKAWAADVKGPGGAAVYK